MKKYLTTIFLSVVIIIVAIMSFLYNFRTNKIRELNNYTEYKQYIEGDITGSELITLINKVIDSNEQNLVEKDDKNKYLSNNQNSINIDVKFKDYKKIIAMESIKKGGEVEFLKYYGNFKFKCTKVEHHKETNLIKYLLFEEV